jgi:hypothetical protein
VRWNDELSIRGCEVYKKIRGERIEGLANDVAGLDSCFSVRGRILDAVMEACELKIVNVDLRRKMLRVVSAQGTLLPVSAHCLPVFDLFLRNSSHDYFNSFPYS